MIKFPEIGQYRTAISNIYRRARYAGKDEAGKPIFDPGKPMPVIEYRGTVKLHGTNAGIVYDMASDSFTYQSRERVLTLQADNAGFMLAMMAKESELREMIRPMFSIFGLSTIAIFGEWCGQGIQKGVSISQLPKMWVVFSVMLGYRDDTSAPASEGDFARIHSPESRIFNIDTFPSWSITVDTASPALVQNEIGEITTQVEQSCPVGKHFGVDGIGEGVVWKAVTPGWRSPDYWFKVKGEKHSVTKVKTLAPVDVEAVKSLHEFVERTVTEARLEQGIHNLTVEQLKPLEITSMGDFLRWVYNDIIKEETDAIVASQIDVKKIGSAVANKARPWFVARLNAEAGLAVGN